jgi:hypothetical protein
MNELSIESKSPITSAACCQPDNPASVSIMHHTQQSCIVLQAICVLLCKLHENCLEKIQFM